jgi:hypothetical protein
LNGTVVIMRKEEFVRRHIKQLDVYNPNTHGALVDFIKSSYLIDIDIFNPWNY